jgi:hypothetical protein
MVMILWATSIFGAVCVHPAEILPSREALLPVSLSHASTSHHRGVLIGGGFTGAVIDIFG